jgi:UDP-N-acetylglucosamine 2-epimerase
MQTRDINTAMAEAQRLYQRGLVSRRFVEVLYRTLQQTRREQ